MGTRFERQLVLDADEARPGRYLGDISDQWNCPIVPHGGIVTAVTAQAMAQEVANSEQRLRTITSVFAAPVRPGPVVVDVDLIRRGRSMTQVRATLRNVDEEAGLTAVAAFGGPRLGFEFTDVAMPEAAPPRECWSFMEPPEGFVRPFDFAFWEHVEGRTAHGHAPWHDWAPTGSERVYWYRFREPPVDEEGVLHPLALVALCDTMPGAVGERMGPTPTLWLPPSVDLTVHVVGQARSEWVLARNRARRAGDGYASLEIELWDPSGELVAYGTQVAFFVFPEGPPDPALLRAPEL